MCPLEIKGPTQRSFQLLDINLVDEGWSKNGRLKRGYQPPDWRRRSDCRYDCRTKKERRCRPRVKGTSVENKRRKTRVEGRETRNWSRLRNDSLPPNVLVIDVPVRRTHLLNCHDYQQHRRAWRNTLGVSVEESGYHPFQPVRYVIHGNEYIMVYRRI